VLSGYVIVNNGVNIKVVAYFENSLLCKVGNHRMIGANNFGLYANVSVSQEFLFFGNWLGFNWILPLGQNGRDLLKKPALYQYENLG